MKNTMIDAGIVLASSTLAGLLTLGLFGHLRDKGWNTWKAGAVTGLIGGGIGVTTALLGRGVGAFSGIGQLPRAYPSPLSMVPKYVASATLKGICPSCR